MSKIGQQKKKILHFYCYTCKAYELKTSPHYRSQKRRFAKRRKVYQALAKSPQNESKGNRKTNSADQDDTN